MRRCHVSSALSGALPLEGTTATWAAYESLRQPRRPALSKRTCGSRKGLRNGTGLAAAAKVSETGPDLRQPQRSPGLFQLSGT